ncbi:MAG: antibiotic biosynthesis monooxygenase [Chloroflexi bacterium]|nr:antibiotic biosynthesis monooxygenase [Chloroflexota bacterium]
MAHMLVRMNVESYAKWRPVFKEHEAARKAAGCTATQVFRSGNDPFEVFVLTEWEELEKARKFAASDDMREAMQKAGVKGQPDVYFMQEV